VAADAQWFVLAVGIVVSLLVGVAVEAEGRRRRSAIALLASEHDIAETLQRSLLPELPHLEGLDLAARYLAGGTFQQVGGDWFDVFALTDGRVGIVIGDVIGHDIAAATAMSQIRASLRAYAWEGEAPGAVLARLDRLIDAFGLAQLVTVFYGVLEAAKADGSRFLCYANAGHVPPFTLSPDGRVDSLAGGGSTVIGAPTTENRAQAEQVLPAGSTLLLFTDGLVEVPGGSLKDSLANLAATVSAHQPTDPAERLCERVVTAMEGQDLRDDIAVLAIRVLALEPPRLEGPGRADVQPVL
jgi:serine phosphatase RsbU (regulator of sigma subunit)